MIVRDNEDTIEDCLQSIYPWVDEIIIVDTGSHDMTPEICRKYGARMYEFPWCDDFSAARNVSIEPAIGEWIFWMDSDDVIDQEQGRRLRELVYGDHDPDCMGYVVQVQCPSAGHTQMTVVDHVKVFRNHSSLRFEHRIHEQILPAIRRLGGDVAFTDIFVVHSGSDQTSEVRERKLERDFRILKLDLEERPEHPFVLFNLGMTCEDAEEYAEAEDYFRRCIQVSTDGESHLRKTWALLVNCLRCQDRIQDAVQAASDALRMFPGDKELLFRRAGLYHSIEQLEAARLDYESVLTDPVDAAFRSYDPGILGHKAHHNLALVLTDLQLADEAIDHWKQAVAEAPWFSEAWNQLVRMVLNRNVEEATAIIESMPQRAELKVCRAISTALCCEAEGKILDAQRILEQGWRQTADPDCLNELARIQMEAGMIGESVSPLERLNRTRPDDPAVLHNLGQAYAAVGRTVEASSCLNRSLILRPGSEPTRELLLSLSEQVNNGE